MINSMNSTSTDNLNLAIRPRFKEEVPFSQEEIMSRLKKALLQPDARCKGKVVGSLAILDIPEKDCHFWSPQLSIAVEVSETAGHSLLRGMYGPAPSVWLTILFIYSFLGLAMMFVLILGSGNYYLGRPVTVLYAFPLLAFLAASLYLVSQAGQRLGKRQMSTLNDFLHQSLE
ncbi:MAG: hypothetical protein IPN29_11345 [Saprospiraceae bacterium]|nr:hypothetical protein [Saprospiraceae bacterium]